MQCCRDSLCMTEWVNLTVLRQNSKNLYKSTSGLALHRAIGLWAWELMKPGSLWAYFSWLTDFLIGFYPKAAVWGHSFSDTRESAQENSERCSNGEVPIWSKTEAAQWVFWCPIRHKLCLKLFAELGCLQQFSPWTLHLSLPLRGHKWWLFFISTTS